MLFLYLIPFVLFVVNPVVILVVLSISATAGTQPNIVAPGTMGGASIVNEMQVIPQGGNRTAFVFFLSRSVEARTFVIERPNRVVIEIPEVTFAFGQKKEPLREGLISALRYGLFAPGRSRIILELSSPAAAVQKEIEKMPDGRSKFTIELTRVEQETFHKTALADASVNSRQASVVQNRLIEGDESRPLIMLDPGHGGIDPGARAGDILEKDIVFAFVKTLKSTLEKEGKYRVLLTRDNDVFVPLQERVDMARAARVDLFISIHADMISSAQIHGFTVYTGSEKATDAESARLAEKENEADAVGGVEVLQAPEDISDILQDLTLRETRSFSNRLASALVSNLQKVMTVNKNPHRMAGFRVLRAPDVPSALVELGYMSSTKDIDLLMSNEWRERTAVALSKALDQYFSQRPAN